MSDFVRTIPPRKTFFPIMTPGDRSWSHSGKPHIRNINQVGREWIEEYPPMQANDSNVIKFLSYLNNLWRNGTIFTIKHKYLGIPANNPITGSLAMNGANQTGSTITVTTSLTQPLLYGDVITIEGINTVIDVVENMVNGADTSIVINPPIIQGMTHIDGAVITYNNVKFRCILDEGLEIPSCSIDGVYEGLILKFR